MIAGTVQRYKFTTLNREQIAEARDMRDNGATYHEIGARFRRSYDAVRVWVTDSELDPVDDEVAITRALSGDRAVFEALTVFERGTFAERVSARLEREPFDRRVNNHRVDDNTPWWLGDLSRDLGFARADYLAAVVRAWKKRQPA